MLCSCVDVNITWCWWWIFVIFLDWMDDEDSREDVYSVLLNICADARIYICRNESTMVKLYMFMECELRTFFQV